MPVLAVAKGVRISPRKVGEVVALVRGRSVADALVILEHTPRRAATAVSKVISSARANADNNHNLKAETLRIVEISVSQGVHLKRFKPAAHGRALPFQKRTSHIRVVVDGEARAVKRPVPKAVDKPAESKKPANKKETK